MLRSARFFLLLLSFFGSVMSLLVLRWQNPTYRSMMDIRGAMSVAAQAALAASEARRERRFLVFHLVSTAPFLSSWGADSGRLALGSSSSCSWETGSAGLPLSRRSVMVMLLWPWGQAMTRRVCGQGWRLGKEEGEWLGESRGRVYVRVGGTMKKQQDSLFMYRPFCVDSVKNWTRFRPSWCPGGKRGGEGRIPELAKGKRGTCRGDRPMYRTVDKDEN